MALFADDGTYWVPAVPDQKSPFDQASLFYDDRDLMKTRVERLEHPRIHVQTPPSRTAHLIGNVVVEEADHAKGEYVVGSTLIMAEYRDDDAAHLRRPPAPSLKAPRRDLPHRAEARRPDQLRRRLRGDGGADLVVRHCGRLAVAPVTICALNRCGAAHMGTERAAHERRRMPTACRFDHHSAGAERLRRRSP